MTLFEEGTALLKQCSAALDQAEQKVAMLFPGGWRPGGGADGGCGAVKFTERFIADKELVEKSLHAIFRGTDAPCRPI